MAEMEVLHGSDIALEGPKRPPPFRPRIAHYLLFSLVCAAVAATRANWATGSGGPSETTLLTTTYAGLCSLFDSIAFTGLLILLGRWWQYDQTPLRHPGHWLLTLMAFSATVSWLFATVMEMGRFYGDSPSAAFHTWNMNKLVMCSTVGVVAGLFAWAIRGNRWWKAMFFLLSTVLIALVPQHVLVLLGIYRPWFGAAHNYACLGVSVCSLPLLFLACWSDFYRSVDRDWLHWTGVVITAITAAVEGCYAAYWILWG
ncbi:hypothetical protein MalM25_28780 [Planctomycetes bacterium MalM25]|nr:hypothetical protein MalM25_28780 [Planctomycetes bacterium MalM25]